VNYVALLFGKSRYFWSHYLCFSDDIRLHTHPIYQNYNTLLSDLSEMCFMPDCTSSVFMNKTLRIYSVIWYHVTWLADLSLPARYVLFLEMLKRERERRLWIRLRSDVSSLAMSMRQDWTCFSFPFANQNMQERHVERQSYFAWIITCDCYIVVALAERTGTLSLLSPECL